MAYVYRHIRLDTNEIFYIGISKNDNDFYKRAYSKRKRNDLWNNIVKNTDYRVEITHKNICLEEAFSIEKYLIFFYGRRDLGMGNLVNMTDGADGNYNFTEEIKDKIRKKLSGKNSPMYGTHLSNEAKENLRQHGKLRRGKLAPMYGKKFSDEHKTKISEANKKYKGELHSMYGKHLSDEHKKKISEKTKGKKIGGMKKGHKMTPEQIEKHRQKLLGKPLSQEHKTKIKESCLNSNKVFKKQVQQIDPKTNEVLNTFNSIRDAAKYSCSHISSITKCCKGQLKTLKGFIWKFLK
jgi:hypothetical protein